MDSLSTIGFVCHYLDALLINNAFEQEIDFENEADCPMDISGACGELLTAFSLESHIDDTSILHSITPL